MKQNIKLVWPYESTCEDVTTNHWPVCPSRPVPCPNECGIYPERQNLDSHLDKACPLTVIDCSFSYAGCNERLSRKDMPDHIIQSLALHMSLQATSHQQELIKLNGRIFELETQLGEATVKVKELETKNHLLQEQLNQECKNRVAVIGQEIKQAQEQRLKGHLSTLRGEIKKARNETKQEVIKRVEDGMAVVHNHVGLVPFSFTMPDFEQKKSSNSSWYSPLFYTHPRGYKMCLRVDANGSGNGKNSHVSVFLYMMRGEYDESLQWPFQGDIAVQLLNQVGDGEHHTKVIPVTDSVVDINKYFKRVVSDERSNHGWGLQTFIYHSNLLPCNYLKNDCLKLCIK